MTRAFGHEDTAIFESFVVPRYLSFFGERLLHMLVPGEEARVCHVGCRTGYPDRELLAKLPSAHIHGTDASVHAIELARAKASALLDAPSGVVFDYRVADAFPLPFPAGSFSHAFCLQAPTEAEARRLLIAELARIVAPAGQVLVAMPLRGSFFELADLLRECSLKYEIEELALAVDAAAEARPSEDALKDELEVAGFELVEADLRTRTLRFEGGRAFAEDPITRLVLLPELHAELGAAIAPVGTTDPFVYVREAIDKYWSDATFELTVHAGVVSGRKTT